MESEFKQQRDFDIERHGGKFVFVYTTPTLLPQGSMALRHSSGTPQVSCLVVVDGMATDMQCPLSAPPSGHVGGRLRHAVLCGTIKLELNFHT